MRSMTTTSAKVSMHETGTKALVASKILESVSKGELNRDALRATARQAQPGASYTPLTPTQHPNRPKGAANGCASAGPDRLQVAGGAEYAGAEDHGDAVQRIRKTAGWITPCFYSDYG